MNDVPFELNEWCFSLLSFSSAFDSNRFTQRLILRNAAISSSSKRQSSRCSTPRENTCTITSSRTTIFNTCQTRSLSIEESDWQKVPQETEQRIRRQVMHSKSDYQRLVSGYHCSTSSRVCHELFHWFQWLSSLLNQTHRFTTNWSNRAKGWVSSSPIRMTMVFEKLRMQLGNLLGSSTRIHLSSRLLGRLSRNEWLTGWVLTSLYM